MFIVDWQCFQDISMTGQIVPGFPGCFPARQFRITLLILFFTKKRNTQAESIIVTQNINNNLYIEEKIQYKQSK